MRLTKIEIDALLSLVGDVDPAHFESTYEEPESTLMEVAANSAITKLRRRQAQINRKNSKAR